MMEKEETGVFNKCVSARAIIFYPKTNLYQNIFVKAAFECFRNGLSFKKIRPRDKTFQLTT